MKKNSNKKKKIGNMWHIFNKFPTRPLVKTDKIFLISIKKDG